MTTVATVTKNAALDAQTFTLSSLHSAFPGTTGANEISGGTPAYARKAITVNASSGGTRLLNAAIVHDVPASTVAWLGFYNVGAWVFAVPNGGATPKNFMAIPSEDKIYSAAHGYADNTTVVFYNGTPPTGFTEGVVYYVRDSTTDSFKVAATLGGAAIDITAPSSTGCWVCQITVQVYASQDTHTLSTFNYVWPD